jgi:hypothetical protein
MEFTYQANDGMFYRVISDGNMVKVKSFRGSDYIFDEKEMEEIKEIASILIKDEVTNVPS